MLSATSLARNFAHRHDDIPAFHAGFLVATFLAAAIFNVGFFLALIVVHMALDYLKYRDIHGLPFSRSLRAVFLESLFDLTLLSLTIVLLLYVHHAFGLPIVSGIARSGMSVALGLGILVPKLKVLEHMESVAFHMHHHLYSVLLPDARFSGAQMLALFVFIVSLIAIALALAGYGGDSAHIVWVLERNLVPWHL